MTINLRNVCQYYLNLQHQNAALDWLQSQISEPVLVEFARRWREAAPLFPPGCLSRLSKRVKNEAGLLEALNQYGPRFGLTTPRRRAFFLAQVAHESDGFATLEEYASGADYEGRDDLGNNQPGDGRRYKGRGLIQITGRYNYRKATQEIRELGIDCPDFEAEPHKLAELPWAVLASLLYWKRIDGNTLADQGKFDTLTYRINGGYNGWENRLYYLSKAESWN